FTTTTTSNDALLLKPGTAIRGVSTASISYWLKAQPKTLTIDILDGRGQVIRSFQGTPPQPPAAAGAPAAADEGGPPRPAGLPMTGRLNRFSWDLTSQQVVSFPGMILWGATQNGPAVVPGSYQARLTVDGKTQTQTFDVKKHPQRDITDAELRTQF